MLSQGEGVISHFLNQKQDQMMIMKYGLTKTSIKVLESFHEKYLVDYEVEVRHHQDPAHQNSMIEMKLRQDQVHQTCVKNPNHQKEKV
jgi:hypothetical protein